MKINGNKSKVICINGAKGGQNSGCKRSNWDGKI